MLGLALVSKLETGELIGAEDVGTLLGTDPEEDVAGGGLLVITLISEELLAVDEDGR